MTDDEKQKIKEDLRQQQDDHSKTADPISISEEMKQQTAIPPSK